jgi:hypothetical protein
MPSRTPTTVHLDTDVARAARIKAAITGKSLSDIVNQGLKRILSEDAELIRIAKQRRRSKTVPYEEVLAELRKNGDL